METGLLIAQTRRSLGMSQNELARKALIPQPNLSAIESCKRDLTVGTLKIIARALGVTTASLVAETPRRDPLQLDRATVERIADAVFSGAKLSGGEAAIAEPLKTICPEAGARRVSERAARQAWTSLKELTGRDARVLLQKVRDASMRHHAKKAD